jgi:hypothetical protein
MQWERCPAVAECDMSMKVDWMSRADCMALIAISNCSKLFPVGQPERAQLCNLSQDYKNLMPRLQAAETVVNANMLRHVRQNAAWHIAVCRQMGGGHCEHLL